MRRDVTLEQNLMRSYQIYNPEGLVTPFIRFELPSYATLGDLRHQANKVADSGGNRV